MVQIIEFNHGKHKSDLYGFNIEYVTCVGHRFRTALNLDLEKTPGLMIEEYGFIIPFPAL